MATKEELDRLMGKALSDAAFRSEFLEDPEAAAKKEGISLTPQQAEQIKKADVSNVVGELEKMESKGCSYHLG